MQIYLLLTERCNLNCKMCIRGHKHSYELTLNMLDNIKGIQEFQNHDIVITGGEPTLCHDFEKIVHRLADIAKTVSICSNGMNDFFVHEDFFKSNMRVQISLDGTEYAHDLIRGKGTYQKIINTITKLDNLSVPYIVATVVSRKNVSSMLKLADTLSNFKKMQYWTISYEMPFGNASFENMMTAEEWNLFADKMLEYVDFRMKIQKLFSFDLFVKYKDKLDGMFTDKSCVNCGSGRDKIYIYPDLNVYPCTCLTDFCLGNIKENALSQILTGANALKFTNYSVQDDSICKECEFLKYCNGGCVGMSYNYFKELGRGDIRCPKLKVKL
ncbi:radical SAM/SPASM domain-containing protein [Bacteroides sp. 224]|uniref:radical SAM/SPASM domain-containing protein n=1 Tax=Bacteroides sp. 224 TaxID=2302936 RepID=UPI0013D0E0DC|nr:radical SAM protein [Bacteroides sp. 224]NDV65929.1 radical SAM protein [Bacteroides sp. 224]